MRLTFEIPNHPSELAPALDKLESLLLGEGLSRKTADEIRLVAEEGLSNIIRYAHDGEGRNRIQVTLSVERDEIQLELQDDGRPFNPLEMPEPDLSSPIEERPEGGLGIYLMKALTDEAVYARKGDRNVLLLKKNLD